MNDRDQDRGLAFGLALIGVALGLPTSTLARSVDDTVVVTATRVEKDPLRVPFAVEAVGLEEIQRHQQLGLDESLNRIPGLYFQNRYNFAQDLSVSIRGFGARSNFGIRGIKILVDGIPSTLPDGQAGVDDIDLGSAARIEVLRGPSSALYGAASGGVISIHTEDGPKRPFLEAGTSFGEYDFGKYQVKTGGEVGRLNYLLNTSYLELDGYRHHARVEHFLVNSKFRYTFADGSDLTWIVNAVDSPQADDAGGLTAAQVATNRKQAQFNNLRFDAGEELDQQKAGWIYRKSLGEHHHVTLRNYFVWRDFLTNLPFGVPFGRADGITQFDRFFVGGGVQYGYDGDMLGHANRLTIGVDVDSQEDDRQRFLNVAGSKGAMTFDQLEQADALGFFVQNEFAIIETVALTLGARYDMVDLGVEDEFLGNGDQTDELEFDQFSPMAGVIYSPMRELNLYANYSTAFETPTFTELANPALSGTLGGFANVTAQTAQSFEIGAKGVLASRVRYDLALFTVDVEDEITNVVNLGGRAFFQNADTGRNGVEAGVVFQVFEGLALTTSYTYSDFEFERFATNLAADEQRLPGLPQHQFYAEIAYTHPSGFYATWDVLHIGRIFADNLNAVKTDAYEVSNLRLGYHFVYGAWDLSPALGINNLFDEEYNQSLRINDANTRYFEPAPDANLYGGLSVRYNFGL